MKKYNVSTINAISEKGLGLLSEAYEVADDIACPDAILVRSAKLHDMDFGEELLYIGRAGAGVNNIPLERCAEEGIVVCNAPGANANAVKELVAAGLIIASRNLIEAVDWTKSLKGQDEVEKAVEAGKKNFVGPELEGKSLGVLGLGAIGRLVADMGIKMGMEVIGYDPHLSQAGALSLNTEVSVVEDLKDLFKEADYVSVHAALTDETRSMVNKDLMDLAKPGLKIMNFARGELVDLDDLKEALESGQVGKYVCDFPSQASLELRNTINIPHLGASTPESEENSAKMVVRQMMDYLENGNIKNSVNYPDIDMGACKMDQRVLILHKNTPGLIGRITEILSKGSLNIGDLVSKHRDPWSCTMADIEGQIGDELMKDLTDLEGVVRVRLIG